MLTTPISFVMMSVAVASPLAAPSGKYQSAPVENGGEITGTVHWTGAIPKPATIEISSEEAACHADAIPDESLVVSEAGGIRWAVVSLESIDAGKPFAEEAPVLDQVGCRYEPHVVVVPEKGELSVRNSDGLLHNVHTKSIRNRSFNRAMPADVTEFSTKFKRKETVSIACDVHAWMKAWIIVVPHPYYTVTDETGSFSLKDVPPGTYTLRFWHETLGELEQTVTVKAGEATEAQFNVSLN